MTHLALAVFTAAVTITVAGLAAPWAAWWPAGRSTSVELDLDAIERAVPRNMVLPLVAEVRRLRDVETLAREALAELDAQPELAHPDAVWYTGAALRDALEADRG